MTERIAAGRWVEIEQMVLKPAERAPQVPADTACVPLKLRTKGWLMAHADLGEQVEISTVIGRRLQGTLIRVDPAYTHDFGRPVAELLPVGSELRALLAGEPNG